LVEFELQLHEVVEVEPAHTHQATTKEDVFSSLMNEESSEV
jgi:hypothetical protein